MQKTESKFEIFKKFIKEYMDLFGLQSWEYHIQEDEMEERASTSLRMQDRIVNFYYNQDPEELENPKKTAFHEVMEVFVAEMEQFAFNTGISETERKRRSEEEAHRIIRTLENVVFPLLEKNEK